MELNETQLDRIRRAVGGALLLGVGIAALAGLVSIGVVPATVLTVVGAAAVVTAVFRPPSTGCRGSTRPGPG